MLVYRDPKESWDKNISDLILEELKKDGFKDFIESEITMEEFLERAPRKGSYLSVLCPV